ncbi:copper resistance D family protein, partial [Devosia sp.]|uniref:copper resistance D family protein n=1 Tax=Devosia sp. TaxID=1871048 RepID=UPI002F083D33
AGVGLALAATGHAGAAEPQWLTRPAVFLHAAGIAFWAGALPALATLLRHRSAEAAAALRRFSLAAPFAVLPLIVAGATLALVQVRAPEALVATAYGRVLMVKLALLVVLFGLAAFNRWRLTRPALAGEGAATRTLVRVIAVEAVLIVAVLGAVATWRFTPPPRTLAAAQAAPLVTHIHAGKAMAEITFASGDAGGNAADILLMNTDFGALDADAVTLVASNRALGVEDIGYPADRQPDGTWKVEPLTIPVPGTWTIRLDVRVSEFELLRLEDEIAFGVTE